MTTSETFSGMQPTSAPAHRLLRRSRTGRVGAGVAAGLGEYFGLDPVLFRVLFATSAFFGGAGILAYLLAWAAIPEEGTESAPIDGWMGALRRRRVPIWLVAIAAGIFLWAVAFSWWAPGPFVPVIAVTVLLVIFFARRDLQSAPPRPTVSLAKPDEAATDEPPSKQPGWVRDARGWFEESKAASRERRRRALPVKIATLGTLVVALAALAIADSITGIYLQIYFETTLVIVAAGLLVGMFARRTPWSVTSLLPLALAGTVAFAGSHAQFGDGIGQREWKPTNAPATSYRIAFGEGILDLRELDRQSVPRHIDITAGAGQVHVIVPKGLNVTVLANVHFGVINVDGTDTSNHGGAGLSRTISAPAHATGRPITIDVHLADGRLKVDHVSR
jgi:phage shock protein PspC (stress-responsive transcriptional regulator)/FtsH-binding integral membrane protein